MKKSTKIALIVSYSLLGLGLLLTQSNTVLAGLQTVPWNLATSTSGNVLYPYPSAYIKVGISTTSPYAALSVVGSTGVVADIYTATNTRATSTFAGFLSTSRANFTGNATNTAAQGFDITNGCFAINGTCVGGGSGGGVTAVTGTYPVFSSGGATPAISFDWSTSTNLTIGNLIMASGANTFDQVATSSYAPPFPFGGSLVQVGTSDAITWNGLSTSSDLTTGQVLAASGVNSIYSTATTSCSLPSPLTGSFAVLGSSCTTSFGTLTVGNGGTGATTFGQGWIYSAGGTGALVASTTPTVNAIIATSTTLASQFIQASSTNITVTGTLFANQYASLAYSSTTVWAGTTTIPLGPAFIPEQWIAVECFTDAGTLNVDFYHTATHVALLNASTTVGTFGWSANNTVTAGEKRFVDIGTPATSPQKISCTLQKKPI